MKVDIRENRAVVTGLYQYDRGQKLELIGCDVADGTEVHYIQGEFNCVEYIKDGEVLIPDFLLASNRIILSYLYIDSGNIAKTIKKIEILTMAREKPPNYTIPDEPDSYSRLLPLGGEIGDHVVKTKDGYEWKSPDDGLATDEELIKVSETIPIPMTVAEILAICK